jgi:hypothetical protein
MCDDRLSGCAYHMIGCLYHSLSLAHRMQKRLALLKRGLWSYELVQVQHMQLGMGFKALLF